MTKRLQDDGSADEGIQPEAEKESLLNRRSLLAGTAGLVGAMLMGPMRPSAEAATEGSPEDPTLVPGTAPTAYGQRSAFEKAIRIPRSWWASLTPLQDSHGILTPSSLHFERHHNGVPTIQPAHHRLLVHGMVDQPWTFTLDDLKRFPAVSRLTFIECSGNSAIEWKKPTGKTAQDTHGLTSTSEWTGVALKTVLQEVVVHPEASWMLAEGSDAAAMTRSLPLASILEEAILCYAQNGEPLRPEQGYPLRLLIPGWEGNTCIKWLRRLKLGKAPFMTREETSQYTDLMPDGTARQFTMVMDAKSVITSPSGGQRLQPGFVEIRGLAWSGRGRITAVEVSTDGGRSWQQAALQEPILPKCHTRFHLPWRWNGEDVILQSRCLDDTGYRQPDRATLVAVRGVNSVYHYNAIQSWHIAADGQVSNVHA
ncbi:MAG: Periplasmic sulfane dehydrogenase, molybdopterin-containing subunit SoxC [Nitrospira sp.]|jgi:sulfane dehydrogenase subunit SoxC|nr:MAG: Periplasmic sulfane dehydrogenase, molybdopterin-containing subunit SoxC [Nitrospira sp.]